MHVIDVDLRRADGQGLGHGASDADCTFLGRAGAETFGIDEIVGVFVQDGLKIVLRAIDQHAPPVVIVGIPPQQGDRVMLIEQRAERPGNLRSGAEHARVVPSQLGRDPLERAKRTDGRTAERDVNQQVR